MDVGFVATGRMGLRLLGTYRLLFTSARLSAGAGRLVCYGRLSKSGLCTLIGHCTSFEILLDLLAKSLAHLDP